MYYSVLQQISKQCWLSARPVSFILTDGPCHTIPSHGEHQAERQWIFGFSTSSVKLQYLSIHKLICKEYIELPGAREKGNFEKQTKLEQFLLWIWDWSSFKRLPEIWNHFVGWKLLVKAWRRVFPFSWGQWVTSWEQSWGHRCLFSVLQRLHWCPHVFCWAVLSPRLKSTSWLPL